MAALNFYIAVQLFTASTRLKYSYVCEPCRQNHDPEELRVFVLKFLTEMIFF